MKITFGITTRNCLNHTRLCLESFKDECWRMLTSSRSAESLDIYLVICDNDSTDGTVKFIDEFVPPPNCSKHFIKLDKNYGTPHSFNSILKVFDETDSDLCFFSNNDVVYTPHFIEQMLEFYKDFPEAGLFSCTCVDNQPGVDEAKLRWFGDLKSVIYEPKVDPEWHQFAAKRREEDNFLVNEGINACLFALTKDCRKAVGNFNEEYQIGCYDDAEYCLLAERAGYRVLNTSNAIIFHFGGSSQAQYRQDHGNNSYQAYNKGVFERKFNVNLDALNARCCRSLFWAPNSKGINERVYI